MRKSGRKKQPTDTLQYYKKGGGEVKILMASSGAQQTNQAGIPDTLRQDAVAENQEICKVCERKFEYRTSGKKYCLCNYAKLLKKRGITYDKDTVIDVESLHEDMEAYEGDDNMSDGETITKEPEKVTGVESTLNQYKWNPEKMVLSKDKETGRTSAGETDLTVQKIHPDQETGLSEEEARLANEEALRKEKEEAFNRAEETKAMLREAQRLRNEERASATRKKNYEPSLHPIDERHSPPPKGPRPRRHSALANTLCSSFAAC